jgi:O-methyltransferase
VVEARQASATRTATLAAPRPSPDAYLDLLKRCLTGYLYDESSHEPVTLDSLPSPGLREPRKWLRNLLYRRLVRYFDKRGYQLVYRARFDAAKRTKGEDWPTIAYTMVGLERLDNVQWCLDECLRCGTPGDLVETACGAAARGSSCARCWRRAARASASSGWRTRSRACRCPSPSASQPTSTRRTSAIVSYLRVGLESVQRNFARFGLLDGRVRFLKGWFADTLPPRRSARSRCCVSTATSTNRPWMRSSRSTTA